MPMPEALPNCPICTSTRIKKIVRKNRYGIARCSDCHIVFTNPRPTIDEISSVYGESYMANLNSVKPILDRICRKRLLFVEKFLTNGRLLDVGSGNGYFLNQARIHGWEVSGTEISEYSINYCKEEFGIHVERGEVFEANYSSDLFDIITMWHTLEHVKNPLDYLKEFNRILKSDGLAFILVPNANFLLNYLKGWSWIAKSEVREHLYFFTTETLISLLEEANFKIIHQSIGNIESIRNCFREKVINSFAVIGRMIYFLSRVNLGESVRIVAKVRPS